MLIAIKNKYFKKSLTTITAIAVLISVSCLGLAFDAKSQENKINLSPKNIAQKNPSNDVKNSSNSSSNSSLPSPETNNKKNSANIKNPDSSNQIAREDSSLKSSSSKTTPEKNNEKNNEKNSEKNLEKNLDKNLDKNLNANKTAPSTTNAPADKNPTDKNPQENNSSDNSKNSLKTQLPKTPNFTAKSSPKNATKSTESMPSRQQINNGFADLVEDLLPCVVNITSSQEIKTNNMFEDNLIEEFPKTPLFDELKKHLEKQLRGPNEMKRKLSSIGSGFIISKDGLIVTNHHVIDDTTEINVNLYDGSKYKAKVVGIDKKTDIALLKINPNKELKFATFGDSTTARIGEWVIVIGNPYGLGGSVSVGIVSARGRDINNGQSDEYIQTDAAINKGNSGGPMFNARGEVIGISTAIFSPSGGSVGIGFATPSSSAIQVVRQLREQGEVTRGWIGVSVQDISEEIAESMKLDSTRGAFVVDIIKDSPADKAGLLPTDIILKFEDQEIEDMKFLPKAVAKFPVGKTAKLQIFRQGKIKNLKVTIEKLKDSEIKKTSENRLLEKKPIANPKGSAPILGMSLAEFKSKIRKDKNEVTIEGLLIVEVNPKSESVEKGLSVGDIILSANQIPTKNLDDLKEIIDETSKGNKKLFLFIRRGESSFPAVLNLK